MCWVPASQQDGSTALSIAAEKGLREAAEALLKAGAAVDLANRNGYTPLLWAAQRGQGVMVRMLLAAKANPNLRTKVRIILVRVSLLHDLCFRQKRISSLMLASRSDKGSRVVAEIVGQLIEAKADASLQDDVRLLRSAETMLFKVEAFDVTGWKYSADARRARRSR